MFTTVLPVWGVALLLIVSCWSLGTWLLPERPPLVTLLAGWCGFLLLCAVPWVLGLSTHVVRPLFWMFFLAGLVLAVRQRTWANLVAAAVCATAMVALLGVPFLRFPGLLAYGAHGLDLWGYVITSDWLQGHSIRDLPVIGVSPMRFNWTWHVLATRERPLIYESLACLASSTGLTVTQAYFALPVTLLASLAAGLARTPGLFRLPHPSLAVPLAIVVAFHPLVVLPWVAGFFGGAVTALLCALALAGAVSAGTGRDRAEALALGVLMLVCCAGLYSLKFLYIALALGGVPAVLGLAAMAWRRDFRPLTSARPGRALLGIVAAAVLLAAALLVLGRDQKVDTGEPQTPLVAAGHVLGIFGGTSPYGWLGYALQTPFDRDPLQNPVGAIALVAGTALLFLVALTRWRRERDGRVPLAAALCAGALVWTAADEMIMEKTLSVFGFALIILLAAVSADLRHRWLGLLAAVLCCLPALRSAAEMQEIIYGPYITCTEANVADIRDGQDWRVLGYLHFREDRDGLDWSTHPRTFHSLTHFLPEEVRKRLIEQHHIRQP